MSREIMQQALDALKTCNFDYGSEYDGYRAFDEDLVITAARALEAELAKPELPRAFREVLIGDNYILRFHPSDTGWMCGISNEMMDAIEEVAK